MTKRTDEGEPISGRFQGSGRGFGFLIPEDGKGREDDWFIPPHCTGGAWNGDTVLARPEGGDRGDGRRSAKITKVVERANRLVTGTVRRRGQELWLEPDSDKLPEQIKLVGKHASLRAGEKAAAEVQSYGAGGKPPMGTLRETFGRSGSREAGVAATLYHYEIDPAFPPDVLAEAEQAPTAVEPAALAGRLDLREKTIVTIDGASSKDLDDAISLERDGDGNWVLGVHIADVSHYVTERSALDLEAWERGTSVYFADRVVPMLPVELSNGICSLNPGVDRLALTCLMTLDKDGAVKNHSMHKSVIRSTERMTYEDCNVLLQDKGTAPLPRGGDKTAEASSCLAERYGNILPMLKDMAALAKILEKTRKLRGSLDLDTSESYIVCGADGLPVDVRLRKQGVSEALIESFMLAANECVAQHLFDLDKPAVYRVHEKPSVDKTEGLKTMLEPFGYSLLEADSFTLQKILDDAKDKSESPVISTMILRSLMKARYDVQNLGHFGLAAKYYCHFTSPIRRYPDLMVHRILTKVIEDGNRRETAPWEKKMAILAQKAAVQSSEREIAAQSAEREIEKLYFAEFMQGHIGEEFSGTVAGVTKYGLFVMLTSGVEGLLSADALPGDRYHYDESHMTLRGEHTGESYTFGMALTVICAAADPGSGRIEFTPAGVAPGSAPSATRQKTGGRPHPPKSGKGNPHGPGGRKRRKKR